MASPTASCQQDDTVQLQQLAEKLHEVISHKLLLSREQWFWEEGCGQFVWIQSEHMAYLEKAKRLLYMLGNDPVLAGRVIYQIFEGVEPSATDW